MPRKTYAELLAENEELRQQIEAHSPVPKEIVSGSVPVRVMERMRKEFPETNNSELVRLAFYALERQLADKRWNRTPNGKANLKDNPTG